MKYVSFYGNLYDCPYGHRLKSCPVHQVNHMPFGDKFNWFEGLTLADKNSVTEHHEICAHNRLKKKSQ